MKKLSILLLGLLISVCKLNAQTLTGFVKDENDKPMEFATIYLRSLPDSSGIAGAITDANGQFNIESKITKGFIQISTVGYVTKTISISTFANPQTISMQPDNNMLNEVVVTTTRPKTKLAGDAIVTTIQGSVLEHAGNSLDVIAKVPGMITKNGNLEIIGRGEPIYYINGRKVTDNSELRNLMSEEIKSIDVVSNPGAEYGGNVRCVVRIRTIKRQGEGFSYALSTQALQHIYNNHDTEPSWSVLDINYRKKGLDFIGKLVYFNQRNYQISDIYGGTFIRQDNHVRHNLQEGILDYRAHNSGWQYVSGINWQINDRHSLGMKIEYSRNSYSDSRLIMDDDVFIDGNKTDHVFSVNDSQQPISHSTNGNIYYDGNIGKLNINFNADFISGHSKKESTIAETSLSTPTSILSETDGSGKLSAVKLFLSYPIWHGNFKFGTEDTYVRTNETYTITKNDIPSSKAHLTENTLSGFAEYAVPLSFGQLLAGIRYEHVSFDYTNVYDAKKDVSRSHNNWFPSFNFSTRLGKVGVSLNYSSKIKRPRYDQMSTEIMYDNRFAYQTGDPTLLNEIQHTLSLSATWQWLALVSAYETINNTVYQRGYPYNDDGVAIIQYSNAKDAVHKLNVYLNASPTFGIWTPRYTIGMEKQFFSTTLSDPREIFGTRTMTFNDPMFFVQANNAFKLKNKWLVDLDYQFVSPFHSLLINITKPTHSLNLAIGKSFLRDDALNVRLAWNDILNKTVNYIATDYGNCFIQQSFNRYSSSIQLRVSYRFNTANNKYKGTGAGQEAKSRL